MPKESFFAKLEELVAAAKGFRAKGFGNVDPEEATKDRLIDPLLDLLGFTNENRDKEFHILGGQVDYLLKHRRPLMFVEAKSLLDSSANLFENEKHKEQVLDYIRNYAPNKKGAMELIPVVRLQKKFLLTWEYLVANKTRLESREDGKMRGENWYGYGRIQALDVMPLPKIFTPDLSPCAAYSLDETGKRFFTGGVAGGYGILVKPDVSREFILGLLNSRILEWFVQQTSTAMRGGWYSFEARFIRHLPIKGADPKHRSETKLEKEVIRCVNCILAAHSQRLQLPRTLATKVAESKRTDCSLAHYIQKDYAAAMKTDVLIDDVKRKGFVRGISVKSDKNHITITAEVAETKDAAPVVQQVVRLTFTNTSLQQFIYASWQGFLETNARKKTWTTGKTPLPVYDLIVNELQSLAFFQTGAADNIRVIRDLMKVVAKEVDTSDLASVESEIAETDREIDRLVYELYGLTEEEIRIVEERA